MIPETLRGKKVEKFEDLDVAMFFHIHDGIKDFSEHDIEKYGTHRFSTWEHNQVKLFYTQPFTPNMIEELFEGWEEIKYEGNDDSFYGYKDGHIIIGEKLMSFYYKDHSEAYIIRKEFIKTLSDFISACNNSDITLIFKEQK